MPRDSPTLTRVLVTSHDRIPGFTVIEVLDRIRATGRDVGEVKGRLRRAGALLAAHAVVGVSLARDDPAPHAAQEGVRAEGVAVRLAERR